MRISDWSSDVCSSDLQGHSAYCRHRSVRAEPGGLQPGCPDAAANLTEAWSFSKCREKSRAACRAADRFAAERADQRSEEHTSELQSLMRISYAVFCLKQKKNKKLKHKITPTMHNKQKQT